MSILSVKQYLESVKVKSIQERYPTFMQMPTLINLEIDLERKDSDILDEAGKLINIFDKDAILDACQELSESQAHLDSDLKYQKEKYAQVKLGNLSLIVTLCLAILNWTEIPYIKPICTVIAGVLIVKFISASIAFGKYQKIYQRWQSNQQKLSIVQAARDLLVNLTG